jgi:two-component system, OmpR family, sensor histidine kinase KdpD
MSRGQLRVYLGAAPGVGKTYAMLAEGQRRRERGTDVVAALVEAHGRRITAAMAEGIELIPRRTVPYRGAMFTEMDTDAVLARHPQVALVDELAHTNAPGSRNRKRWQDVDELLDAGIDVIVTLNIQHLESLSDVARQITGVAHTETIPDEVVRRADQVELVDMTPEALRRRLVHGNVYAPDRIEEALTHYFRPGNLTAMRELALLWVADRVEEGLRRYRAEHGIATAWETNERIVVCIAGGADDEAIIRRAARIAARSPGSELLAVHVRPDEAGLLGDAEDLALQRALVMSAGGTFQVVADADVAGALLAYARAENATQMVLGATRRGRLRTLVNGSVPGRLTAMAGHIDIHLVGHDQLSDSRPRRRRSPWRSPWTPLRAWRNRDRRLSAEATALRRLAIVVLAGHDAPALLEEVREMFGLTAVSLLEHSDGSAWYVVASAGEHPLVAADPGTDAAEQVRVQVGDAFVLTGRGRTLSPEEYEVLEACTVPLVAGISRRLRDTERTYAGEESWRRSRWTVLAAASEDACRQVTTARAALTAIAASGAGISKDQLSSAWRALHRIDRLATDLSALGRLHSGALETYLRPVDIDEVLTAALDDLGPGGHAVTIGSFADLPDVIADAALLTRVLTSLLADALANSTYDTPSGISVGGATGPDATVLINVSAGQHWPDPDGLAVRLARDLTEAMGGILSGTDRPGDLSGADRPADGGTVLIALPAARPRLGSAARQSGDPVLDPGQAGPAVSAASSSTSAAARAAVETAGSRSIRADSDAPS